MTPYASFLYFAFLLYPVVPAVLLGLIGRMSWRYVLLATLGMLVLQYGLRLDPQATGGLGAVALYTAWELAVVRVFAWSRRRGRRPWVYYAAVGLALAPLAAVKFWPLLAPLPASAPRGPKLGADTFGRLAAPASGAALPPGISDAVGFLGVSYLTFRVLDTIICIWDGVLTEVGTGEFLTFLLFFPTISSGPIDRFRRFRDDLRVKRTRAGVLADAEAGVRRIAQGFLYKFVIAELIYRDWMVPAAASRAWPQMASYMYAYTFYLFFDFAGYTAFAIGAGRFFGIRSPENFSAPFLARNFRDLWSRWNMSLSFWLRDHVYMRFVLGATRRRWFRDKRTASYVGFLLTMGLMGLWHGPRLNYLVYGVFQGAMMVVYDLLGRWNRGRRWFPDNAWTHWLSVAVTFNLFCFSLLIFSGHWFG